MSVDRRLSVQLAVLTEESTRWRTRPIQGYPGKVVLATTSGEVDLTIHLDRVSITRMQSALEGALATLERDFPAA